MRIGRPQRREFASWRYGRQFIRRRINAAIITAIRIAASAAMAIAGIYAFSLVSEQQNRIVARVKSGDGRRLYVPLKDARALELARAAEQEGGWTLIVPYRERHKDWGILGQFGKGKRLIERMNGERKSRFRWQRRNLVSI